MEFLALIMLVTLLGPFVASEPTAVVNTTTGPVQGIIRMTVNSSPYAVFVGIRYAEPPVGYRRFQPPVPAEPWTETLNAIVDGDVCPQKADNSTVVGAEDCLFLNVFTPTTDLSTTPTVLKSVMVWIYGGAFVAGSSDTNDKRPDFLLERDVIFVSLNYRLGALGFLTLNHPNATGNQGLKDQNLALKWVQANIEKFGGNPNNVTIFGESAGAASVGLQVISDASAGLFQGAISMSGTPLVPWGFGDLDDMVQRAERFASILGASQPTKASALEALYAASPEELVLNADKISPIIPFKPTLEDRSIATDVFLSECSIDKYNTGNFSKVPQLLGFMQQETIAFVDYINVFDSFIDMVLEFTDYLSDDVLDGLSSFKDVAEGANHLIGAVSYGLLEAAVNVTTDLTFKAQIDETQRLLVKNMESPVYYYDITFFTNRSLHNLEAEYSLDGAGHADDLAYIFYIPSDNYDLSLSNPMGLIIYRVSTMWTNFAKYGNPTPDWVDQYPLNITWPSSGSSGQALEIGNELTVVSRPINIATEIIELGNVAVAPLLASCQNNN